MAFQDLGLTYILIVDRSDRDLEVLCEGRIRFLCMPCVEGELTIGLLTFTAGQVLDGGEGP